MCGQDPHRGEYAGGDIGEGRGALYRGPSLALPGHAHDPTVALGDEVEAPQVRHGAGPSEPRDLAVDEAGVRFLQQIIPEAEAIHRAGTVILDQHVGSSYQPASDLEAGLRLEVQGYAALVPVQHHEGGRLTVQVGRTEATRRVSSGDRLHLDHIGPHVGEHPPAGRTGHDVRELDDA